MRLVLTLFGGAAYLVLAILGWGGLAPFFAHRALVALALVLGALCIAAACVGGNISPGIREDRGNRWVLAAFGVIGLLDGYLPALADRLGVFAIEGPATRWLGVVLFAAGGALRPWPVHALGDRFSGLVAIQPGHTLVTSGVYGVIRNPSYLGLLVGTLGWGLAFRSGVGIVLTALLLPPLVARIEAEERLLSETFGADYAAYRARTWRLVPGIY